MKKRHALGASVLLGAAAIAGMLAVTRTVQLGQASSTTPASSLEARAAALDQAETQIRRLDASVPPALPPRTSSTTAAQSPVAYVRAPSIAGAEEEWEDEEGGEAEDHGDGGHDDDDWEQEDDD